MSEQRHTPGPYVIGSSGVVNGYANLYAGADEDAYLGRISAEDVGHDAAVANAEFIVDAMNAHDPLVAALRSVEWQGTIHDCGAEYPCCPECGGFASEPTDMHPGRRSRYRVGHEPDCKLAAALALAAPADSNPKGT